MTYVDPALERQLFDTPEPQWIFNLQHLHEADLFGRGVETAERTWRLYSRFAGRAARLAVLRSSCHIGLTGRLGWMRQRKTSALRDRIA